ncbi:MAG: AAA family ATPase, partial [Chloroflexi bacterium]|nr:AAA family ATPase [Chloroflexota bacterium]
RVKKNGTPANGQESSTVHIGEKSADSDEKRLSVYAYGIARNRLIQASKRLGVHITLVNQLPDADVLVTLKNYYRKRRKLINDAERRRTPVYVLRANTVNQMQNFLMQALNLGPDIPADPFEAAIADAERGIELIQAGQQNVDLRPTSAPMRRYQHQMARQAELVSHSYGKDPGRYVRIFKTARINNS